MTVILVTFPNQGTIGFLGSFGFNFEDRLDLPILLMIDLLS